MKGQEAIKKARKAGKKPSLVHVSSLYLSNGFGDVYVSPDENLGLIDWRFLVGCTVAIDSDDEFWLKKATKEISEYASRTIGTLLEIRGDLPYVLKVIDSEGYLSWPKS